MMPTLARKPSASITAGSFCPCTPMAPSVPQRRAAYQVRLQSRDQSHPTPTPLKLALFDLDHTLLDGDSDSLWGRFLVREGAVDAEEYQREGARYMAEYRAGRLDIHEFLAFGLRPLKDNTPERLQGWRAHFMQQCVLRRIPTASRALLKHHREQGHTLVIITATNSFI